MFNKLHTFSYKLWFWSGNKCRFFTDYNKSKAIALDNARRALEEAFTPQLAKLLKDGYCEECGYFNGEDKDV
jgi:hypothetical protein